jgi:predicted phage gp36 major capsid-like protein
VHANARAVLDWIAVSREDGSTQIVVGPERRPEVANPTLVFMAMEGRDLANLLAVESERPDHDIVAIDAEIREASAAWIPEESEEVAG